MIKEFAFGLANRHHFGDVHDIEKWAGMAQDTFMSLWDYDNHVIDYVKQKGTLASYDGMLYMPDEFILDVDGSNPDNARQKTVGLGILLDDLRTENIYKKLTVVWGDQSKMKKMANHSHQWSKKFSYNFFIQNINTILGAS